MINKVHQLLVFKLDAQKFSLHLAAVDRIERAVEVTPLPKMPENVLGIVNLKGQIVPVFNVRRQFHLPEREVEPRDQLIFAHTARRSVALVVDAAGEVIERRDQDVIASGEILPDLEYVEGVVKLDNGLVLIHDLDRFLSAEEENALEEAMKRHD
jgi:purine-binding chemotaxis protein CheW